MSILRERAPGSDWKRVAMRRMCSIFGVKNLQQSQKETAAALLGESLREIEAWIRDYQEGGPEEE